MTGTIWTYWHQGFEHAPFVVRKCVERIQQLHPNSNIHLLDEWSVYDFADQVPLSSEKWEKLSLPHKSDLLRTQLLIKHGGVWLDPTVFCMVPLQKWLPQKMNAGLFLFHQPGPDRIISNWFIAAEKNNYLLKRLYQELIDYWNNHNFRNQNSGIERSIKRIINGRSLRLSQLWLTPFFRKGLRIYPYMIYHNMFYRLIQTDPECCKIWRQMPKVSAVGPHRLQRLGLLNDLDDRARRMIDAREEPLFKLKWKLPGDTVKASSNLDYLFVHFA